MRFANLVAAFVLCGGLTGARAGEKKADKPSFKATRTSTVTSTVQSVDQKTRLVTLKSEEGESVTFKADDRIKNLKQMKKGDLVTATLTESLTARVVSKNEAVPIASEGSSMASAPSGMKPAAYKVEDSYVVAEVVAIDKPNMIVTLRGPKGNTYPVKAKEKKNVDKLAVGDHIELHAARALAIEVTTPQSK